MDRSAFLYTFPFLARWAYVGEYAQPHLRVLVCSGLAGQRFVLIPEARNIAGTASPEIPLKASGG